MKNQDISPAGEAANRLEVGGTYRARIYRSDQGENPPAFADVRLHVHKHKGQAVSITTLDRDWAEMDPRQEAWIENDMLRLMAEDYCLDIMLASIDARGSKSDA